MLQPAVHLHYGITSLQQRFKFILQFALCRRAYELVYHLTVFEEQYCRDVADTELHGYIVALFDIAFAYNDFSVIFFGKFADNGSYGFAGAAPCCPKVNY